MDVLVIGAGIVGAPCAQELAAAGLSVGILEKSEPAFGATAAGMGHILVLDDGEAQLKLTAYSRHLWHAFSPSDRTEFRTTGTLWVASNDEEMRAIERRRDFYCKYAVDRWTNHFGVRPPDPGHRRARTVSSVQRLDLAQRNRGRSTAIVDQGRLEYPW
jgi:glycine/D-amino acid oxidase-like deaminating enzyme